MQSQQASNHTPLSGAAAARMWGDLHDATVAYLVSFQNSYPYLRENLAALTLLRGFCKGEKLYIGGERIRPPHPARRVIQNLYGVTEGAYVEDHKEYVNSQLEILAKLGFVLKRDGLSLCPPERFPENDPRRKLVEAIVELHALANPPAGALPDPLPQTPSSPALQTAQAPVLSDATDYRKDLRLQIHARLVRMRSELKKYEHSLLKERGTRESELELVVRRESWGVHKMGPEIIPADVQEMRDRFKRSAHYPRKATVAVASSERRTHAPPEETLFPLSGRMSSAPVGMGASGAIGMPLPNDGSAKNVLAAAGSSYSPAQPVSAQKSSVPELHAAAQRSIRTGFERFAEEEWRRSARQLIVDLRVASRTVQSVAEEIVRGVEVGLFDEAAIVGMRELLPQMKIPPSLMGNSDLSKFDPSEIQSTYQEFVAGEPMWIRLLTELDLLLSET